MYLVYILLMTFIDRDDSLVYVVPTKMDTQIGQTENYIKSKQFLFDLLLEKNILPII